MSTRDGDTPIPAPHADAYQMPPPYGYSLPSEPAYGSGQPAPKQPDPRQYGRVGIVPWTFVQTVAGVAITLVPWVTVLLATQAASAGKAQPTQPISRAADAISGIIFFLFTGLVEAAFLIAPAYQALFRRAPGTTWRDGLHALGFRRTPFWAAVGWVICGLAIVLIATYIYSVLIQAFNLHLQTNGDALMQQARVMPLTVLGALAGAVVIAPFCEETFFRGYAFAGFLRGMSIWVALPLSALLFGIAHGDVGSFAPLFVFGLVVAFIRWRTGSIWPGMALHMCNNALAAIAILPIILK